MRAIDSADPLVRSTALYLSDRGSLQQIRTSQQLDFQLNGKRQYVQVTPWRNQSGLDWLVVIAVPESDFMGKIQANTRTTIALCLAALLLSTLMGLLTSRWITQAILRLSNASKAISNGQLDQQVAESQICELDVLARSFNQMSQQLRDSFAALADSNESLEVRVRDRTEKLSQALDDLKRTQAQLVQQEKMSSLGQMVAGIAHEINNPVGFIQGNLGHLSTYSENLIQAIELYWQHYPQPIAAIAEHSRAADLPFVLQDLPQMMHSMQEGTRRICEIVTGLRNFSRLDEAQCKTVCLHDGIDNTLLLLQHRLKASPDRQAIAVEKRYGLLPPIDCYPGQLNQVFMNFMTNAIDAIDEKFCDLETAESPILTIATALQEATAIIAITDNGIGMSEKVRSRIFDPFFTTKPVGQGTGLGLAISYKIIVEQHQGCLHCTSTPGIGTHFSIELPLMQTGEADVITADDHSR